MDDRVHSFGYWLQRRRKALDLTQEKLAKQVACSHFTIRKIESDQRSPSLRLAQRLADTLEIEPQVRTAFLDAARARGPASRLQMASQPIDALAHQIEEEDEFPPFVGRGNEHGQLLALLARLDARSGYLALISGEPGIGKSRLMRELVRHVSKTGGLTLKTRCYEIERAVPYQPIIDIVTQALEHTPTVALQKLPPVSLAEIAALVPAAAEPIAVPSLSADFAEARRARLFRAIGQLLDACADAARRLVVIVDDIQWADDASAQFLHYLGHEVGGHPLLVVYAYRDEALAVPQLAGLVDSLSREAHARPMPLAWISTPQV